MIALPTSIPATKSACIAELDRKPQHTWEQRYSEVCRTHRIYPMAHYDCYTDPGEPWDKWLPEVTQEVVQTLSRTPKGIRCLGISGQRFGTPAEKIDPGTRLDSTEHAKQLIRLVYEPAYQAVKPDLIFVDSENDWLNLVSRRTYWGHLTSVFDTPVALWNHVAPSPRIPCEYEAGVPFMGRPIPGGVSNPQCYIGWYVPARPEKNEAAIVNPSKLTDEWMWQGFIRTINNIRSCLAGGMGCIPHLPVCHPDPVLARWYTEQVIWHARLAGCTRFIWLTNMSDDVPLMADTIAGALETVDIAATSSLRPKYYSATISGNAKRVSTRGYVTESP